MKSIVDRWCVAHTAPQRGLIRAGTSIGVITAVALLNAVTTQTSVSKLRPAAQNIDRIKATVSVPSVNLSFDPMTADAGLKSPFRPTLAAAFERPDRGHAVQPLLSRNGVIFVSASIKTVGTPTIFEPPATKANARPNRRRKRGPNLAALQNEPSFLHMTKPDEAFLKPAEIRAVDSLPIADAITALEVPSSQNSVDRKPTAPSTSIATADAENRRAATLGIARDSLRYDDRPGRLSSAAEAGVWNGQPAAAVGLGYTLPSGWARVNATGVSSGQKTFGVTAVASIALQ